MYVGLKGLFDDLTGALAEDPPLETRMRLTALGRRRLRYWLNKYYVNEEAGGLLGKRVMGLITGSRLYLWQGLNYE